MPQKKLIIDFDPGVDDAWALLIALTNNNVDVVAITAVFGNGRLHETRLNILRILTVSKKLKIPVYVGCEKILAGQAPAEDDFFGKDGLGDTGMFPASSKAKFQKEPASEKLVELAKASPGELTLVAIGPLTNVSCALTADSSFGDNLKEIFIMGGNSPEGEGNAGTDRKAEYNFYNDPEAVNHVLNNVNKKMTVVPLDVCLSTYFGWDFYDNFMQTRSKKGRFLRWVETLTVYKVKQKGTVGYRCFDQHAVISAIDDDYILEAEDVYCKMHLKDITGTKECIRGRLEYGDPKSDNALKPLRLVRKVEEERLKAHLVFTIKTRNPRSEILERCPTM